MSERRLRGQAEQFKHQRDEAFHNDLKRKNLFSEKREIFTHKFRCSPVYNEDQPLLKNQDNVLLLLRDGMIDVTFENLLVGRIEFGFDTILDALNSDPRSGLMLNASICLAPSLSGTFEVQISE